MRFVFIDVVNNIFGVEIEVLRYDFSGYSEALSVGDKLIFSSVCSDEGKIAFGRAEVIESFADAASDSGERCLALMADGRDVCAGFGGADSCGLEGFPDGHACNSEVFGDFSHRNQLISVHDNDSRLVL